MLSIGSAVVAAVLALVGLGGNAPRPRAEVGGTIGVACIGDDGGCGPMRRRALGAGVGVWLNGHEEVGIHATAIAQHHFLVGRFAYHFGRPQHARFYAGLGAGGLRAPHTSWHTTTELFAGISVPAGRHLIVRGGGAAYATDSGFDTELLLSLGYRLGTLTSRSSPATAELPQ